MANPNRTVAEWRRKHGFPPRDPRPVNPELAKIMNDCQSGLITVEEGARRVTELMNRKAETP